MRALRVRILFGSVAGFVATESAASTVVFSTSPALAFRRRYISRLDVIKVRGGNTEDEAAAAKLDGDESVTPNDVDRDTDSIAEEKSESNRSPEDDAKHETFEDSSETINGVEDTAGEGSSVSDASTAPEPAILETTTTTLLEQDGESEATTTTAPLENDSASETVPQLTSDQIDSLIEEAGQLRTAGKELHDAGDFIKAAEQFATAANSLLEVFSSDDSVVDDLATCRLHEALCYLKAGEYQETIRACSDVLELPGTDESALEPALRARAFHRRAKALVGLGDETAALEDARSAAFLGDQRAVALYGKLMRENSGSSLVSSDDRNPLEASGALFESLLNKSSSQSSNSDPFGDLGGTFPSTLLDMMGAGSGKSKKDAAGGLARSVLSNLSKRLDEESTQDQICSYLQNTSGPQLRQFASMAGMQLPESQANRIARFCQGVTPKTIRRTLRTSRAVFFVVKIMQKISQVISKYRSVIILFCILGWAKSAILRPLPTSKRSKAAKGSIPSVI